MVQSMKIEPTPQIVWGHCTKEMWGNYEEILYRFGRR